MRKTILLLVAVFTATLSSFTNTTNAFAQQYPGQQYPARRPATPTLDQLKARNFTVKTLNGENISLNTLLGEGKPVLIDFWATWCGPCRMVIPHLGELHRKYSKDGLIVIGLNLEDSRGDGQAVKSFVRRNRMDYQNVFAPHAIYQFFSGMAAARIPYTLLFGPDGKLTWNLVGYSPQVAGALNGAVEKAMAATAEKAAERAPEKQTEPLAPEKQTEPLAPEKQTEPVAPEKQVVPSRPEKQAEPVTPEKQAEPVAPEKQTEPVAPEKQTEPVAPEKQTEPVAPEKQVVPSRPEKKGCECTCPCCSSHRPEKPVAE